LGRHWLDVARFAVSTGMDEDHVYPNAWRFRDHVVQTFNDDMPFDRFIREQILNSRFNRLRICFRSLARIRKE
jgi:hypothetical protein